MGKRVFYDKRYYDTKLTGDGVEQSIILGQTWDNINDIQSSQNINYENSHFPFIDIKEENIKV